jgi:ABC-type uncharacterized transport system permease subunit
MRLWLRYVGIIVRSQMQYRLSSVLLFVAQFLSTLTVFLGSWLLFRRFGTVAGWSFHEVALFFSVMLISFALAEMTLRGRSIVCCCDPGRWNSRCSGAPLTGPGWANFCRECSL